jgi:uncharacterized protein involved in exopolysaccharide biosynthesis
LQPIRDSRPLLESLRRRPRTLVAVPLAVGLIAAGVTLVRGPVYLSESMFTPQVSQGAPSGLMALAAQFGVSSALPQTGPPIDFYAELIRSQEFLGQVARSTYRLGPEGGRGSGFEGDLVAYYGRRGADEPERLRRTVEHLRKRIKIRRDPRANLVIVQVQAPHHDLAQQINRRLLDLLDSFNQERRQSQASAERRFAETRMAETLVELQEAERQLKEFHESNIGYENSPTLRLEAQRLMRRLDQRQQVYLSLSQAYEQARIDEVRDTPVITTVMNPEGWVRRERGLLKNGVLGLLFGLVLAAGLIFGGDYLREQQTA